MGGNFAENRGNAMFSIGYADREAAWEMNRPFFVDGFKDPGTPANYPRIDYPYYTTVPTNLPSQAVVNQVLGTTANQSRSVDFYVNPLDATVFRQQNALGYTGPTTFPYKIRSHNNSLEQGSPRSYASTPLTRYSAFGRTVYDMTDSLRAFAQGTFVMTDVNTVLFPTPLTGVQVPHGNGVYAPSVDAQGNTLPAYRPGGIHGLNCAPTGGCTNSQVWPVPAELGALLDSRQLDPDGSGPLPAGAAGTGMNQTWNMSRIAYWYPNRASENETKLSEFVVGLEGDIGDTEWTWEGYSSFGETILLTHMKNFVWLDHYASLVQQPNYGRGGVVTETAANSAQNTREFPCTSGLPIFEPWILDQQGEADFYNDFHITQDCLTAVTARMSQRNVVEQRVTEVNFQGKLADLSAGELRGAFGVSTRLNESLFEPDALFLATVPAGGQTNVDEIYGEVLLPVTRQFDLEFGGRYSDFTTGEFQLDAKSYKALFNWTANDAFRFRGGWQRANRTPNVAELYSGPTSQVYTWAAGDACRWDTTHPWGNVASNPNRAQMQQLCAELLYKEGGIPGANEFDQNRDHFPPSGESANVYRLLTVGNPRLRAETADTYTLGMIWQPDERDISLTADFYQIEIDDVVDSLGFLTAYQQCFNVNGVSNPSYDVNNEFCQAIHRNPETGAAGYVEGGNFNLSKRFTNGLDVTFNWRKDMAGGEFGINSSINKLFSWKQPAAADPDAPLLEYVGYGAYYDYRLFTQFSYSRDKIRVGLNWRYLPQVGPNAKVQTPTLTTFDTEAYSLFNANVSWAFNERMRLRGGIDNLIDEDPPIVGANPLNINNPTNAMGSTSAGSYDTLGRRYYVGLAVTF
jgi:outer membrane receptor protein involved in Fe transport